LQKFAISFTSLAINIFPTQNFYGGDDLNLCGDGLQNGEGYL